MMNSIFLFLIIFFADKDKPIELPFLKVDSINSNSVLLHINCAEKLMKNNRFFPVYWKDEYVGVGMCGSLRKDNWLYAKVYLEVYVCSLLLFWRFHIQSLLFLEPLLDYH